MSNYSNFSTSPEVRDTNSQFEPELYNKVGGISGCTGASNNVQAANAFPGYNFVQKGGRRRKKIKGGNGSALGLYSVNPVGTDILQAPNGGVLGDPKGLSMKGGKLPNYVIDTCQNPQLNNSTSPSLFSSSTGLIPYAGSFNQAGGKLKKSKKHKKSRKKMYGGDPRADPQNYADGVPYYGFNGVSEQTAQMISPGHAPVQIGINSNCSNLDSTAQSGGRKRSRKHKFKKSNKKSKKNKKLKKLKKSKKNKKRKKRKTMKGGSNQFLSNIPYSASYSTGGIHLPPSELGLANPVPYTRFINCPEQ